MIKAITHEGVEIKIETISNEEEIAHILEMCLIPEFIAELNARLPEAGEIFFEFTGGKLAKYPEIQHFLVHLSTVQQPPPAGNFIIVFYGDAPHIEILRKCSAALKSKFKVMNKWNFKTETFFASDVRDVTNLPIQEVPKNPGKN
jgi:hypothetical protein